MIPPTLTTERLTLRVHRNEDVEAFLDFYASDASRFVGGPMSREMVWRGIATEVGHWTLRGYGRWAVELTETGQFCGTVGLWSPVGWPEPEIGWTLVTEAQGKGIAREAAEAARSYAYDTLGWTTAISLIDPDNAGSIALAKRLGATQEGVFQHERFGPLEIWRHLGPEALA